MLYPNAAYFKSFNALERSRFIISKTLGCAVSFFHRHSDLSEMLRPITDLVSKSKCRMILKFYIIEFMTATVTQMAKSMNLKIIELLMIYIKQIMNVFIRAIVRIFS